MGRLTEDGAAQALGWSRARVTARIKLLELPERAQRLVGAGAIPLSAVDQLRAIGQVSPELLEAVIEFLADGNEWAAERLTREPGWVLDSALREGSRKVFAAHLVQLDSHEIAGATTLVATREGIVYLEAICKADIAHDTPMQIDSIFWIASMTKPVTSVAARRWS